MHLHKPGPLGARQSVSLHPSVKQHFTFTDVWTNHIFKKTKPQRYLYSRLILNFDILPITFQDNEFN